MTISRKTKTGSKTKTKTGSKTNLPAAGAARVESAPAKRKPGRPAGSLNKGTVAIREAIGWVFNQLQIDHGGPGPASHLLSVAKQFPLEFYRIAVRVLPLKVEIDTPPAIGVVVFRGIND